MTSDPKLPVENGPVVPNQPNSAPADNGAWILNQPRADSASHVQSGPQLWLHRSSVFLFVLISAVAGVLLLILPWTRIPHLASHVLSRAAQQLPRERTARMVLIQSDQRRLPG